MSLLKINNIETLYGLIQALRGVSLEIPRGRIVTILGANGAGKSTILKTVMGLIEDQPDKGTIEFDGRRIDGKETEDIARMGISFVPEGREVVRGVDRDRKPGHGGLRPQGPDDDQRRHGPGVRALSPAQGTAGTVGRNPVRRRTTDAGHLPGR